MSDPQSASAGDANDNALAKTAGFVVFSGIVMSILKALTPLPKITTEPQPLAESTQQINIPPKEPLLKKPNTCIDQNAPKAPESSNRTIQIVKGDTLWGLSRKYGAFLILLIFICALHKYISLFCGDNL
ncbi:uncharacterized protein LOC21404211 [Morus notabilis]|uniref:uncharacterized protein LOC21404211 n=1 Tax=Morus notabilis TaxID=981085 RepID=UPI000CED5FB8|nr:uncharacterized protein LOC21404211 [Morus notabilis]